jgi:hypothetical protein
MSFSLLYSIQARRSADKYFGITLVDMKEKDRGNKNKKPRIIAAYNCCINGFLLKSCFP